MKLVGYELTPQEQFQRQLSDYVQRGAAQGSLPPAAARPVYEDDDGQRVLGMPTEDGVVACPFIPGSKADLQDGVSAPLGGFVPVEGMPEGKDESGEMGALMSAALQQMPQQLATQWVANAAKNLMLGGGPGGMLDAAMQTLGVANPIASGPLGSMLSSGLAAAGLGPVGGFLQGALGDGLGNLTSDDDLADLDLIGGCFPAGSGSDPPIIMDDPEKGGLTGATNFDPNKISAEALDEAANYLASQWKVDDESSAAEHIAHKAVMDHKGTVQQALKDELTNAPGGGVSGLMDRVKAIFTGVPAGTGQPAIRVGDPDDKGDVSVQGVGNILFETKEVSRLTDKVAGAMAPMPGKQIVIGEPSVLSAGLPTAFELSLTEVPSVMSKGAATVLVGGAAVAGIQAAAKKAQVNGNAGPAAPKDPKQADSGSGPSGDEGDGESDTTETADATRGEPAGPSGQDSPTGKSPTDNSETGNSETGNSETGNSETGNSETGNSETGDSQPEATSEKEDGLPPEERPATTGEGEADRSETQSGESTKEFPVREGGPLGGPQAEIRAHPEAEADHNRNQYQDGLCPSTRPYWGYTDPVTGISYGPPEVYNYYHIKDGELCHRGSGGVLDDIHTRYDQTTIDFIESKGYDPAALDPSVQCCYDVLSGEPGKTSSYDFSSPSGVSDVVGSVPVPGLSSVISGPHVDLDVNPAREFGGNYPQVATSGRPSPPPPPVDWTQKACCFAEDTWVSTPNGIRAIGDLMRGDMIRSLRSGQVPSSDTVTEIESHLAELCLLTIVLDDGEEIRVTPRHPFYDGQRWVESHRIHAGDCLAAFCGSQRLVREVIHHAPQLRRVLNVITASGTYVVGRAGLIVGGNSQAQSVRHRRDELLSGGTC